MAGSFTNKTLLVAAIAGWLLAIVFGLLRNTGVALGFVAAGSLLFLVSAFAGRMHGPTTFGKEVKTNLAPDPAVAEIQERGTPELGEADHNQPPEEAVDPSQLVARWPTLGAALDSIPLEWSKQRSSDEDGHEYVHIRTPEGGYELVINAAALDSAAPKWLLAAIMVIEKG